MLALMTGVSMASLDTAIANTALPELARQLHAGAAASVWIVNIYQLAMVATLLPFAALGERVGYRRVAMAGLALFTVASLFCALAWNLPLLVGARLLQGLGAAALMGVTTAMMRAIYPAQLQGQGFGLNALVVAVAFAVGPTLVVADPGAGLVAVAVRHQRADRRRGVPAGAPRPARQRRAAPTASTPAPRCVTSARSAS